MPAAASLPEHPSLREEQLRRRKMLQRGAAAFARCAALQGLHEATFMLGTATLRVAAAGADVFAASTGALSHLRIDDGRPPSLTVYVWETAGRPSDRLFSEDDDRPRDGSVRRRHAESGDFFAMVMEMPGPEGRAATIAYAADFPAGAAYGNLSRLGDLPALESAAPLRPLLAAWMARHGLCLAHAACVGLGGKALLLAGPGGSGKSTTSLICASQGWTYFADDYTLVQVDHAAVRAFPLYNSAKLNPDSLAFFPKWKAAPGANGEKATLSIQDLQPDAIGTVPSRITDLIFPTAAGSRTAQEPRLEPLSAGEALRLLAPSSLLQLPTGGAQAFAILASIVRLLPCWRLKLSADPPRVAGLLRDFLNSRA
jgi:hypothetical protein